MATAAKKKKPLTGRALKAATEEFVGKAVEGFSYSHELVKGKDVYNISLTSSEIERKIEAVVKGPQGFLNQKDSMLPLFLEGAVVRRICVCEEGPFSGFAIHYTNLSGKEKMFRLLVGHSFVGTVSCEVFLREDCTATA
jgi:hypothetical protein